MTVMSVNPSHFSLISRWGYDAMSFKDCQFCHLRIPYEVGGVASAVKYFMSIDIFT